MYDAFKELKHTPASKGISFHLLNERQQMHSIHLHHVRNSFSQARHFRFVCVVGETKRREKKKCPTEMRERNSHSVKKSHSVTVKHSRPVTSKTSTSYLYSNLTQVSRFKQKKALSLLPGKKSVCCKTKRVLLHTSGNQKASVSHKLQHCNITKASHEKRNKLGMKC